MTLSEMVISLKLVHEENAKSPMLVTLLGMVIDIKFSHE